MSKTYYKVVTKGHSSQGVYQLCSMVYQWTQKRPMVTYIPNKWVNAPDNTRLFVFDDLDAAKDHATSCGGGFQIWECSVKGGISFYGAWAADDTARYWDVINKYMATKKKFDLASMTQRMLEENIILVGLRAILVKSVKLTKKVVD